MEWTQTNLIVAGIVLLLLGGLGGSMLFPQEKTIAVPTIEKVEVVKEVLVEQEVIKEVPVEDTERLEELQRELSLLKQRYEQLADEPYIASEIEKELEAIEKAKSDFLADFKHKILRGFKASEVSVTKWYDEKVQIKDVTRTVDGKTIDYEKVTVWFELEAKYEDEDGSEKKEWEVKVEYDIDSDGHEEPEVTVTRV